MRIIHDDRFYSVQVEVHFISKLDEKLSIRNLVKDLLVDSSNKYNSKQKVRMALDDMYGATLKVSATTLGIYHDIVFSGNVLCDKYTMNQEKNVQVYLDFLYEIIYNPNDFSLHFDEIKNKYLLKLQRLKEDIGGYSIKEALRKSGKNTLLSIDPTGDESIIKNATLEDVVAAYQKMITEDTMRVYVAGNIKDVCFKEKNVRKIESFYINPINKKTTNVVSMESDQSFVNVVYNTNVQPQDYFALILANEILGGLDGVLFKTIREKMGLCYSIFSQCFYYENVLLIHCGVSKNKIETTLKEIYHQVDLLKQGCFQNEDLENAKKVIISNLKSVNDSLTRKIHSTFHNELRAMNLTIDQKIAKFEAVTKEDIIQVLKQFTTIHEYIVEGETNHENT